MRSLGVVCAIILAGAAVGVVGNVAADGDFAADASSSSRRAERDADRGVRAAQDTAPVLIAVGDIAYCKTRAHLATGALVQGIPGTVATLGDHAYNRGTKKEFVKCYNRSWGAVRHRTRPAPGNHDYLTKRAKGYFGYFGAAAGDPTKGYYSYDLGAWHIIVVNSNCAHVGGCHATSPQGQWLRNDLAAHPAECTLAYWHHPLFSSGKQHGGDPAMRPVWDALYDAGADVVLSAHEHHYERFALQDPNGTPDANRGIRQFVVGTGGAPHYGFGQPLATSEVREASTFGVLVLTLHETSYDWVFVPASGTFTDTGSAECQ